MGPGIARGKQSEFDLRCADKIPIYATTVVCCQQKNGALLRTSGKREYIHAVCAYWNPKISKQSDVIKVDPRLFAKKVRCDLFHN
jgi:hypothetical protein